MVVNNFLDNAQARAASLEFISRMQPFEDAEDLIMIFRVNADAVVLDREFMALIIVMIAHFDDRRRFLLRRELDRIVDQIQENFGQFNPVANDRRHALMDLQVHLMLIDIEFNALADDFNELADINLLERILDPRDP